MSDGCLCQDCGRSYRVDLIIPDNLWVDIRMPVYLGMLCGVCIMTRLEQLAHEEKSFGYLVTVEGDVCCTDELEE